MIPYHPARRRALKHLQVWELELDEVKWVNALKLEGYEPRRSSGPVVRLQVLFPDANSLGAPVGT